MRNNAPRVTWFDSEPCNVICSFLAPSELGIMYVRVPPQHLFPKIMASCSSRPCDYRPNPLLPSLYASSTAFLSFLFSFFSRRAKREFCKFESCALACDHRLKTQARENTNVSAIPNQKPPTAHLHNELVPNPLPHCATVLKKNKAV